MVGLADSSCVYEVYMRIHRCGHVLACKHMRSLVRVRVCVLMYTLLGARDFVLCIPVYTYIHIARVRACVRAHQAPRPVMGPRKYSAPPTSTHGPRSACPYTRAHFQPMPTTRTQTELHIHTTDAAPRSLLRAVSAASRHMFSMSAPVHNSVCSAVLGCACTRVSEHDVGAASGNFRQKTADYQRGNLSLSLPLLRSPFSSRCKWRG